MSYNDCILEGVQRFKLDQPETDIYIYSPESLDEAEKIFSDWLVRPESNIPVLFVLATSDYEPIAERYLKEHSLTANKSILLFESRKPYSDPNIHTFQISMYGASYLAGATASRCCGDKKALALLANDSDSPIGIARDGFIAGFQGEIPGSKREECGNYLEHDLADARIEADEYLSVLETVTEYTMNYKE